MSGDGRGVIVSDPGRRPDLFYAAKGLGGADLLRKYVT